MSSATASRAAPATSRASRHPPDGSCKAAVGTRIDEGFCGDVDLAGITVVAIIDWPKAIHDGNGKAVFVVPPAVTEETSWLPRPDLHRSARWHALGDPRHHVRGRRRRPPCEVQLEDDGINSSFRIPGVGEAQGSSLKNPVTGEEHAVAIVLETQGSSGRVATAARAPSTSRRRGSTSQLRGQQLDRLRVRLDQRRMSETRLLDAWADGTTPAPWSTRSSFEARPLAPWRNIVRRHWPRGNRSDETSRPQEWRWGERQDRN